MNTARFAIDSDQVFYLKELPTLNGLLEQGITLFVDKEFQNYNDMTLTQYSIAKRKPNILKFLLDKLKDLKVKEEDILNPKTSNTRSGLLKLAIEFGSIGFYKSVDNTCLQVIIEAFSDYIKSNAQLTNVPLINAIRLKNIDAVKTLIKADANFFFPLTKKDQEEKEQLDIDPYHLSETPLMVLYKSCNDEDQLKQLFDDILTLEEKAQIIKITQKLKINGKSFLNILNEYKLEEVKNFVSEQWDNYPKMIRIIEAKKAQKDQKQPPNDFESTPITETEGEGMVCSNCHKATTDLMGTSKGLLCQDCRDLLNITD